MPLSSSSSENSSYGSDDESISGVRKSPRHRNIRKAASVKALREQNTLKPFIRERSVGCSSAKGFPTSHGRFLTKERNGLIKSSSSSSLQNAARLSRLNRRSPLANSSSAISKRRSRSRNTNVSRRIDYLQKANETTTDTSSSEDLSTIRRLKQEPTRTPTPTFHIEEPIVVGDYSNPFDSIPNPTLYQQKMRDAIDLNRYLWLTDNLGFCRRSVYRPFLLRNLSYMNGKLCDKPIDRSPIISDEFSTFHSNGDHHMDAINHTSPESPESPEIKPLNGYKLQRKPDPRVVSRMPATIKFNFIRNNLCFGDRSAIVQCFHASEVNFVHSPMERIPSATFDMKVNEKLEAVSIDLPEEFGIGFNFDCIQRIEYFIVRVVFRYEDAEVHGKRLRKVPSRQTMMPMDKNMRLIRQHTNRSSEEVVMFGTRQIISFSKSDGLNVVHGETSIVLHSMDDLKISNNWMQDTSFLGRLLKLQSQPDGVIKNTLPDKIALRFILQANDYPPMPSAYNVSSRKTWSRESSIQRLTSNDEELQIGNSDDRSRSPHDSTFSSWFLRNLDVGSMDETEEAPEENARKHTVRVLNASYMCFFCMAQMKFSSMISLFCHLRLCHPRFNFTQEVVPVSKDIKFPGFAVSLNYNYDSSYELNPSRHYIKLPNEKSQPRKRTIVDPIWIVTKNYAKCIRNDMSLEEGIEFGSSLLVRDVSFADGIRHGARYCFEPPTKINHPWMIQSNSRDLCEITDLHHSERAMMKLWNDFLLEIRITHLARKMAYKASRVFVEMYRETITEQGLRIHVLLHLTNLMHIGCIDEEERYDLMMRLDPQYDPRYDNAHFVCKQIDLLEKDRISQGRERFKSAKGSKSRVSAVLTQMQMAGEETIQPNIIECLEDLKMKTVPSGWRGSRAMQGIASANPSYIP
ncbi:VEFS-Box of polycomb protein [Ditylenchus destructor]|nr:VEFS-Box of polycomb protein [Ditylenchus destructor]